MFRNGIQLFLYFFVRENGGYPSSMHRAFLLACFCPYWLHSLLLFQMMTTLTEECIEGDNSSRIQVHGNNFVPSVLTIEGMGLAVHYEELAIQYDGATLIIAYILSVSGKSPAVSIAMALMRDQTSIGG